MRFPYWRGAAIGFIVGTAGMWLLAMLSLTNQFLELLFAPFLAPGRFFAAALAGSSASTGMVVFLLVLSGLFYVVLGVLIEYVYRILTRSR